MSSNEDVNQSNKHQNSTNEIQNCLLVIENFFKKIWNWVSYILLSILPPLMEEIGVLTALGYALAMLGVQYYYLKQQKIRAFPKILDIAIIFLSLGLLLSVVVVEGEDDWISRYNGMIVNGGLITLALFSVLIQKPFTIQYAMDVAPPEIWHHPRFLISSYVTSMIWVSVFFLSFISNFVPLLIHNHPVDNKIGLIFYTVIPIFIILLGYKITNLYVGYACEKAKKNLEKVYKNNGNNNNPNNNNNNINGDTTNQEENNSSNEIIEENEEMEENEMDEIDEIENKNEKEKEKNFLVIEMRLPSEVEPNFQPKKQNKEQNKEQKQGTKGTR